MSVSAPRLHAYALFAALLSAAGLPIYIHAPKFYVDEYAVSLGALGAVLFGLRLLDVVQDPLLGRLSERLRHHRGLAVALGAGVMALAMIGLFAVTPPVAPLIWFGMMLTLVFSGFSFLTICFYAQGVAKADSLPGQGHLMLARWRETGALLGVCVASVAPVVLGLAMGAPFAGFALGFAVLAIAAVWSMWPEWRDTGLPPSAGFGVVLSDPLARKLLLIALINAAPVAVSSTLFLFYVEIALDAPGWEGPLLLLFFLSAAGAAPFWGMLAEKFGGRPVLLSAMVLGILAFGGALFLGSGDAVLFAVVCVASGAVLGADLTLLPAMFAKRMADISPSAAEGFGLWSFVSKFTLALAAVALLPVLESAGLKTAGEQNPAGAVQLLIILYAGVPCALKLIAIALLSTTRGLEDA
ncbi:Sodium:galactoside symporter family protein [Sulfitobacter noctilucicola]|uniref:GPH family glycoside/pentoside/hexuronide:cation symporter n=1 Tax=Sulfitobacter noctilucicola TaxID=1342301 RepID=A0A7W6M5Z1_9RHOB|nr:MFS transporter [Sulfitobacter noctilucicola]KIN63198.1 Sodium:galactoside symporter family protein [Sulfitobacter noctilucicola]MBB4172277.1 GPH family glycoside/pentoside/hexuronide:cation symporter [Sulfitobacter noctilucicola]